MGPGADDYSTWVYAATLPRCVEIRMHFIAWNGPHKYETRMAVIKILEGQPSDAAVERAVQEVFENPKYFRVCERCQKLTPDSYMHGSVICMGCAPDELEITY